MTSWQDLGGTRAAGSSLHGLISRADSAERGEKGCLAVVAEGQGGHKFWGEAWVCVTVWSCVELPRVTGGVCLCLGRRWTFGR